MATTTVEKLANGSIKLKQGDYIAILMPGKDISRKIDNSEMIVIKTDDRVVEFHYSAITDSEDQALGNSVENVMTALATDFFFNINEGEITARLENLENEVKIYESFQLVTSGTTGTVSKPEHASIQFDRYNGYNAIVTKSDTNNRPVDEPVYTELGALVHTTLDASGNYVLSGTPAEYNVCIVFCFALSAIYNSEIVLDKIVSHGNLDQPVPILMLEDATLSNKTVNLPQASSVISQQITVKKIDNSANTVTIDGYGTEKIDGKLAIVISRQYTAVTVESNGTEWSII